MWYLFLSNKLLGALYMQGRRGSSQHTKTYLYKPFFVQSFLVLFLLFLLAMHVV